MLEEIFIQSKTILVKCFCREMQERVNMDGQIDGQMDRRPPRECLLLWLLTDSSSALCDSLCDLPEAGRDIQAFVDILRIYVVVI